MGVKGWCVKQFVPEWVSFSDEMALTYVLKMVG